MKCCYNVGPGIQTSCNKATLMLHANYLSRYEAILQLSMGSLLHTRPQPQVQLGCAFACAPA